MSSFEDLSSSAPGIVPLNPKGGIRFNSKYLRYSKMETPPRYFCLYPDTQEGRPVKRLTNLFNSEAGLALSKVRIANINSCCL